MTKIIERKKQRFVGTVQLHKNFAFVVSTDPRMYTDFFVQKDKLGGAQDGDRVIVRIDDWRRSYRNVRNGACNDGRRCCSGRS